MDTTQKNKYIALGIIGVMVLLFALYVRGIWSSSDTMDAKFHTRVGTSSITDKDIAYEMAIEKVYGNQSATESDALAVLVRDTLEKEVAKASGISIARADIDSFKSHVDTSTKAPQLLEKIKAVFGADTKAYEDLYLLPRITNIALHAYFDGKTDLNKDLETKMNTAISKAGSGESFMQIAQENALTYATSTIAASSFSRTPAIITVLEGLKAGQITPVLEDDQTYTVARLISSPKKGVYAIESLSAKKRNYDDWYAGEATKIQVQLSAN